MTTVSLSETINFTAHSELPTRYTQHETVASDFLSLIHKVIPGTKLALNAADEVKDFLAATQWYGIDGADVGYYRMRPAQCHNNCKLLLFQQQAQEMYTGLALSDDGIMRPHSWVKNSAGYIIETTEKRLFYLWCMPPVKRQDRPKDDLGNGPTVAIVSYYNHNKGRKRTSCVTGSTPADAKEKVKSRLINQNHPVMARQVDKAHSDCASDEFVHLVYEDGDEWIMSYVHMCYYDVIENLCDAKTFEKLMRNPFDEKEHEAAMDVAAVQLTTISLNTIWNFMFFDHCFLEDTINNRFEFVPETDYYEFTAMDDTLVLDYLSEIAPHFTERLKMVIPYYMPMMEKLPNNTYRLSVEAMKQNFFKKLQNATIVHTNGCPCCGK